MLLIRTGLIGGVGGETISIERSDGDASEISEYDGRNIAWSVAVGALDGVLTDGMGTTERVSTQILLAVGQAAGSNATNLTQGQDTPQESGPKIAEDPGDEFRWEPGG